MFQRTWLLFYWSLLFVVEVTVPVPVLEDDSWNLDWPLDLDLNDDGSRSVKTTRPLIILCRDADLVTRRPPGNDEHFILVKPTGDQSLSTRNPCLVTRHPPVLRRTSTPKSNNLALWPAIVIGTPGSVNVDDDALQNVASQLLGNDVSEIGHGNLINTLPSTPGEIEVPCGCDGDDDDVHTHEYLPNDDVKEKSTHKPVTSNVVNIPQGKQTDPDLFTSITTPFSTTGDDDVLVTRKPEEPLLTRKPEEPLLWSVRPNTPKSTTTPKTRVVTKIVTSISANDVKKVSSTTPKITSTTISPSLAPVKQADDDPGGNIQNTSQNTSLIGNGKLLRWLYFLSKQAVFILFAFFIFGFISNKKNENTSTFYYPPTGNIDLTPDVEYSNNLMKVYDNVLTSLNNEYGKEESGYGYNYPLPTNYANSQNSDVYDVSNNEHLVQLDYILNVINDVSNVNFGNSSVKGYG